MTETPSYVRRILDISTAHVSGRTAELIRCERLHAFAVIFEKGDYGWLVYVPSEPGNEDHPDFPADLKAVMVFARKLDCDWIMFDRDGVILDELPAFDW